MENELSHQEITAIEKFVEDLKRCYKNYLTNHQDEITKIFMNYVLQTLDIHLQLAQIKFERWANNMERCFNQQKSLDKT